MHERVCCHDEAANHQLSTSVAFWVIQLVSAEECSSLMQNLMQIHCSTHSVILNVIATQYTCSLNSIYCPHWLVQWSCHCSHMCIPVHSPWLPGYNDVTQTILIILTMAGLFLDRPCIFICMYVNIYIPMYVSVIYYYFCMQKLQLKNIAFSPNSSIYYQEGFKYIFSLL